MAENQSPQQIPPVQNSQNPGMSKGKKITFGCLGAFAFFGFLILTFVFAFIGSSGQYDTPLAGALGVDPVSLVTVLSTITNIFFLVLGAIIFVWAVISVFQYAMMKKEDPLRKKHFWKTLLITLGLLVLFVLWVGSFFFLNLKAKTLSEGKPLPPIFTEPTETIGLTAPVTISFDGTGAAKTINQKYRIIGYLWDFGDGENGTGEKISHTYADKGKSNGQFVVKLTLNLLDQQTGDLLKSPEFTKIISVENVQTGAMFTATPEKGSAPLEVQFDASSSKDPDGQIATYEWDFNEDGVYDDAKGAKATHTFDKNGDYKVSLRVTDNSGGFATYDKTISVNDANSLQAVINVTAENSGKFIVNKNYLFDGSNSTSPKTTITKYEWNFGDNTAVQRSKTVSHSFKADGIYQVMLRVTDENGTTNEKTQKVIVGNPPQSPKALIQTIPAATSKGLTGSAPLDVQFDATKSTDPDNNITQYSWDFDSDGVDDQFGALVTNTFEKVGTYSVTLTVEDADGNQSKQSMIVVVSPPGLQAKLLASPVTGTVPLLVSFDASGSTYPGGQIISYEWSFGDGSAKRQDAAKLSYKYNKVGTYTASVTAIGADGTRNTSTALITVQVVPVKACFEVNKHSGTAPFEVIFTSNCSTGSVTKYRWDLNGDGIYGDSVQPNLTYKYSQPGTYDVGLEVTDGQGVVDIFHDSITVTAQ